MMANSVLCTECGNWVHGRGAKIEKVTAKFATRFIYLRRMGIMEELVDLIEKFCDEVETANGLCYLEEKNKF